MAVRFSYLYISSSRLSPCQKQLDCDVALGYNLLIVGARGRFHPPILQRNLSLFPPSDAGVHQIVSAYIGEPVTPTLPTSFLRAYDLAHLSVAS
jgi:hypothetical protein